VRSVTNPTQSQTSPAALVIYSLNCLSPARISYSRPTRRLIASLSPAPPHAPPLSPLFLRRRTLRLRAGLIPSHTPLRLSSASPPPFPPPLVVAPPSLVVYVSLSLLLSHTRICIYLRTLNDASVSLGSYSDGRLQSGAPSHTRVRADDEPDTRPTIGEEGSALWLTTTKRRTSRTLLPKASRASASPATPISKHVFFRKGASSAPRLRPNLGAIVHFSTSCPARPPKRIAARAASQRLPRPFGPRQPPSQGGGP
jgi:hypothetical protein